MVVCHCRAVTDCAIRDAVIAGAHDVETVAARCGAGGRCSGCRAALEEMILEMESLSR